VSSPAAGGAEALADRPASGAAHRPRRVAASYDAGRHSRRFLEKIAAVPSWKRAFNNSSPSPEGSAVPRNPLKRLIQNDISDSTRILFRYSDCAMTSRPDAGVWVGDILKNIPTAAATLSHR
jgi:hypothetical protein